MAEARAMLAAAEKAGKVVGVGAPVVGAIEGWYVPRYVIEGDAKVPALLARAMEKGARVFSVIPHRETLEDLFVSIFRDACTVIAHSYHQLRILDGGVHRDFGFRVSVGVL